MDEKLSKLQREVDELYEKDGLTDEVLKKQVEINRLRHEYNIPEEECFIFEEYVQ